MKSTQQWTPLHAAAAGGHPRVVQLLLRKGANPQLRSVDNKTALHAAADAGCADVVRLLLEAWGEPQIPAADLVAAAKAAAFEGHMAAFAWLAKELQRLYPAELHQLFEGNTRVSGITAAAAVLDAWASDTSSLDEQRAAVRRRDVTGSLHYGSYIYY
jgi:ankyrin repeat protein